MPAGMSLIAAIHATTLQHRHGCRPAHVIEEGCQMTGIYAIALQKWIAHSFSKVAPALKRSESCLPSPIAAYVRDCHNSLSCHIYSSRRSETRN